MVIPYNPIRHCNHQHSLRTMLQQLAVAWKLFEASDWITDSLPTIHGPYTGHTLHTNWSTTVPIPSCTPSPVSPDTCSHPGDQRLLLDVGSEAPGSKKAAYVSHLGKLQRPTMSQNVTNLLKFSTLLTSLGMAKTLEMTEEAHCFTKGASTRFHEVPWGSTSRWELCVSRTVVIKAWLVSKCLQPSMATLRTQMIPVWKRNSLQGLVNALIEHHPDIGVIIPNRYLKVMFKIINTWDIYQTLDLVSIQGRKHQWSSGNEVHLVATFVHQDIMSSLAVFSG